MKLSRRQFMKKMVAAGAVLPCIPAIAKKIKYPYFNPTGCCLWYTDLLQPRSMEEAGKILNRRIKNAIPPAYTDKILVYCRVEDYRRVLKTMIIYRPDGDTETYAEKIQWILEDGWFRYLPGEFGNWDAVFLDHNNRNPRHPGDYVLFHHINKLFRRRTGNWDGNIYHHIPGPPVVFDDKNYGVILCD